MDEGVGRDSIGLSMGGRVDEVPGAEGLGSAELAPSERDDLMTAKELAALLAVPATWIYTQSRAGRIPTVKLGRYYRYRRGAIATWIVELESKFATEQQMSLPERTSPVPPGIISQPGRRARRRGIAPHA